MPIITEYRRQISNRSRSDHPRDHQSDYWYISSPVSDVVETYKDSSLLVSAIFTVNFDVSNSIIPSNEVESNTNSNIRYIRFSPTFNIQSARVYNVTVEITFLMSPFYS